MGRVRTRTGYRRRGDRAGPLAARRRVGPRACAASEAIPVLVCGRPPDGSPSNAVSPEEGRRWTERIGGCSVVGATFGAADGLGHVRLWASGQVARFNPLGVVVGYGGFDRTMIRGLVSSSPKHYVSRMDASGRSIDDEQVLQVLKPVARGPMIEKGYQTVRSQHVEPVFREAVRNWILDRAARSPRTLLLAAKAADLAVRRCSSVLNSGWYPTTPCQRQLTGLMVSMVTDLLALDLGLDRPGSRILAP